MMVIKSAVSRSSGIGKHRTFDYIHTIKKELDIFIFLKSMYNQIV